MTYFKTIWLIDDDKLFHYITTKALQVNNFCSEIRSFTSAQKAFAELEASLELKLLPDIIFLDLNMPEMDGWQFLKTYRKLPKEVKEYCTLYILSSSIDEDDINRSKLHEDVRDFLSKPLNKRDLEVIKFQAS